MGCCRLYRCATQWSTPRKRFRSGSPGSARLSSPSVDADLSAGVHDSEDLRGVPDSRRAPPKPDSRQGRRAQHCRVQAFASYGFAVPGRQPSGVRRHRAPGGEGHIRGFGETETGGESIPAMPAQAGPHEEDGLRERAGRPQERVRRWMGGPHGRRSAAWRPPESPEFRRVLTLPWKRDRLAKVDACPALQAQTGRRARF